MKSNLPIRKSRLDAKLDTHENQFNLIRFCLAVLVMFDHAGIVSSGVAGSEPIKIFGFSTGYLAVNGFFVMSGIFITQSLARRGISAAYFASRLLRLFPALITLAVIATLIIGPLVSKTDYWMGAQTFAYASEILRFGDTAGGPVGFYPDNPYPLEFDAPLWTLRYEFLCYMAAPLFFLMGLERRPQTTLALVVLLGAIMLIAAPSQQTLVGVQFLSNILRLSFCFGLGMLIWSWRCFVWGQASWILASSALVLLSSFTDIGMDVSITLWTASIILYFGLRVPGEGAIQTDLSYGLYIWHYPIMQIITGEFGVMPWTDLFLLAMPISLLTAWLSWTYIERPALRLKKQVGGLGLMARLPRRFRRAA